MNIKWHYHYVQSCNEILKDDIIDISPDKHGRWQIKGYLYSSEMEFPVVVCVIQQEQDIFTTRIPCLDKNLGLYLKLHRSNSPRDLISIAETELTKIRTILNGA